MKLSIVANVKLRGYRIFPVSTSAMSAGTVVSIRRRAKIVRDQPCQGGPSLCNLAGTTILPCVRTLVVRLARINVCQRHRTTSFRRPVRGRAKQQAMSHLAAVQAFLRWHGSNSIGFLPASRFMKALKVTLPLYSSLKAPFNLVVAYVQLVGIHCCSARANDALAACEALPYTTKLL